MVNLIRWRTFASASARWNREYRHKVRSPGPAMARLRGVGHGLLLLQARLQRPFANGGQISQTMHSLRPRTIIPAAGGADAVEDVQARCTPVTMGARHVASVPL